MFAVSPVASASGAALRPQLVDEPERIASVMANQLAKPVAFDPRTTYALTADAVLSLVRARQPASDATVPTAQLAQSPKTDGPENAPQPQRTGDTRAAATVRSDVDTGSQRSGDAVPTATALDRSIAESKAVRQAEDAAKWDAYIYSITHIDSSITAAISFYLMCNDVHYQNFKAEHPSTDVRWINVDNKKIVSLWPKVTDQWFSPR